MSEREHLPSSQPSLLHPPCHWLVVCVLQGRDWSGTRWQDFIFAIQAVQDCPSTPDSEQPFLANLSATVYEQGVKNGMDWACESK